MREEAAATEARKEAQAALELQAAGLTHKALSEALQLEASEQVLTLKTELEQRCFALTKPREVRHCPSDRADRAACTARSALVACSLLSDGRLGSLRGARSSAVREKTARRCSRSSTNSSRMLRKEALLEAGESGAPCSTALASASALAFSTFCRAATTAGCSVSKLWSCMAFMSSINSL